ncbi:MAG: hypothetical protein J6T10_20685 [Methanobrevibacter sp.]|nr:hypothetical protein [Methanobrevibacter sp.]
MNSLILGTTEPRSTGVSLEENNSRSSNSTSSQGIISSLILRNLATSFAYLRSSAFSVVKNLNFLGLGKRSLILTNNEAITELSNPQERSTHTTLS